MTTPVFATPGIMKRFVTITARMGSITFGHEGHSLEPTCGIEGRCDTSCRGEGGFPRRFDDTVTLQKIGHEI